jgi:hypothetical protein
MRSYCLSNLFCSVLFLHENQLNDIEISIKISLKSSYITKMIIALMDGNKLQKTNVFCPLHIK